jgi:PAS domain S-box-containing protein
MNEPGLRVLVVDDNEVNRLLLEAFLKRLGHTASFASNGADAVDTFRRERPDLVLMDVMMPGMNGFEAARKIKCCCGERWVPLIFVTALDQDEDLVEGLQAGGDDYLHKPLNFSVLGAKLRAFGRTLALQRKLNDSLRRAQAISDSVVDSIITADAEGVIQSCNRATMSLFGYREEELLGRNVSMLMPQRIAAKHGEYMRCHVETGVSKLIGTGREVVGRRKDGSHFPAEVCVTDLKHDDPTLFVGVMRDISERQRAEAQLKENAERLQRYHDSKEAENALARELLDKLLYRDGLKDARLRWGVQGAENFSGDVVAAARSPQGVLYVMLADAAGHGLAAAISLVPALNIFYAMVERNLPLSMLVEELNVKLQRAMPVGRFVAAAMLCIDEKNRRAEIWMGGMPDAFCIDEHGVVLRRFRSQQPALGIVVGMDGFAHTEQFRWQGASQIVLCSDGVPEAQSSGGEPFGMKRLLEAVRPVPPAQRWRAAWEAIRRHLGGRAAHDDLSLVLIDCVSTDRRSPAAGPLPVD